MHDKKMVKACTGFCEETKSSLLSEYRVLKARRFRADYFIPEYRVMIEVQGGLFQKKGAKERYGHFQGNKALKDFEKMLYMTLDYNVVLLCIPSQIGKYIQECLELVKQKRVHRDVSDFVLLENNVLIKRGELV